MKFLNRFIPWLCFATLFTIIYMVVWHFYKATLQLPNVVALTDKEGSNDFNIYFIFYSILYFIPFIEISCFALFVEDFYSEKMKYNFKYTALRSITMLIQVIFLSIIYFMPCHIFSESKISIMTGLFGVIYVIWVIIAAISYDSSVGFFWNLHDYIERLNDYHKSILYKENNLKDFLKNTQF